MTSEPPTESVGRNRPAAGARRAALGIEDDDGGNAIGPEHRGLLDALSHIPDLERELPGSDGDESSSVWDVVEPPPPPAASNRSPDSASDPASDEPPRVARRAKPEPVTSDRPRWRTPAFFLALVVLVASIPALGYVGYRAVYDSRDGQLQSQEQNPKSPGYEAQVDPTATAVVVQYGPLGNPVGVTFLSLGPEAGGGGVVFVPLSTEVPAPQDGINRLADTFSVLNPNAQAVRDRTVAGVSALLDLGIEDVAEVDDARLAALAEPVAPIVIDNPEPVVLADGTRIGAGQAEIAAAQVGPYLAATRPNESDVAQLTRSQVLWTAWLGQIRASTAPAPVGGELTSGIGQFLVSLSKGQVDMQTLPVAEDRNGNTGADESVPPDVGAVRDLVTELVPSPTPTGPPGFRFRVRLLNGVEAGVPPSALSRSIVGLGGTVTIIGNAPAFGQQESTIVYADPKQKGLAALVLRALGGNGKAILDRTAPDSSDFTLVLGRDILANVAADDTTTTPTAPSDPPGPVGTLGGTTSTTTSSGD